MNNIASSFTLPNGTHVRACTRTHRQSHKALLILPPASSDANRCFEPVLWFRVPQHHDRLVGWVFDDLAICESPRVAGRVADVASGPSQKRGWDSAFHSFHAASCHGLIFHTGRLSVSIQHMYFVSSITIAPSRSNHRQFVVVKIFFGLPFELSRVWPLIQAWFLDPYCCRKTTG